MKFGSQGRPGAAGATRTPRSGQKRTKKVDGGKFGFPFWDPKMAKNRPKIKKTGARILCFFREAPEPSFGPFWGRKWYQK